MTQTINKQMKFNQNLHSDSIIESKPVGAPYMIYIITSIASWLNMLINQNFKWDDLQTEAASKVPLRIRPVVIGSFIYRVKQQNQTQLFGK